MARPQISELNTAMIDERRAEGYQHLRKASELEVETLQQIEDYRQKYEKDVLAFETSAKLQRYFNEYVRKIAEGRVYTGLQALEVKLIDEIGGLFHAIDVARDLANIRGKPEIVVYLQKRSFMMSLIGETLIKELNLKKIISNELLSFKNS